MPVKLAIIYYSSYGTNHQMASIAAEAARAAGADVRLRKVHETAPDAVVARVDAWRAQAERTADIAEASVADMEWADAYLFSAPTRFGVQASQMRAFIDTLGPFWANGGFNLKPVSAMTSAQNLHGGQETTLLSFYASAIHWGAVVVAPGYSDPVIYRARGNPYGYSHTMGDEFRPDDKEAIAHQTRRLIDVARRLQADRG